MMFFKMEIHLLVLTKNKYFQVFHKERGVVHSGAGTGIAVTPKAETIL